MEELAWGCGSSPPWPATCRTLPSGLSTAAPHAGAAQGPLALTLYLGPAHSLPPSRGGQVLPQGPATPPLGGPSTSPVTHQLPFHPPKPKLPPFPAWKPPPSPPLPTTGPSAGLSSVPTLGHCPWRPCLNHFIIHSNIGTQMQCDILEQRIEMRGKRGKIRTRPQVKLVVTHLLTDSYSYVRH